MKLSSRLQHIADRLPEGCRLADIGSDHALLPVWAVKYGKAAFAVAGEVNDGPLEAARRQVAEAGLNKHISVRKGDGLAVIKSGEVDVITIAGMGGALIASILESGKAKLVGVKRLVLQPNVGEDIVRQWLYNNEWYISDEAILEEDGKIYEVITADAVPNAASRNKELYQERTLLGEDGEIRTLTRKLLTLMGPRLTAKPNEVFVAKWDAELQNLERIRRSVASSELPAARQKEQELTELIDELKEVLACLRKDKL